MHRKRIPEYRAQPVTPKSLAERRAEAVKEMQGLLDAAKGESRAMTEDETKRLTELEDVVKGIDRSLEAEKRALETLKAPVPTEDPAPEPLEREVRATGNSVPDTRTGVIPEADKRAFMRIIHNFSEEKRAGEQNFNVGNNGAIIPQSIAQRIITEVKERCPVFARATRYAAKGTLKIPVYGDKTVDGVAHNITVGYQTEFNELVADAGAFTSIDLSGYLVGALTLIGKQLINNSDIPVFDFIISEMARKISEWIEKELLTGTGSNACTGILTGADFIISGSTSAISADMLIDLQAGVPTTYQRDACWTMHPKTFTMIRKLKDSTGQYLLQNAPGITSGFPFMILGKPVYLSDFMPQPGENSKAIIYGDYSGLSVNMREQIEIEVLREKYHTMHAIGIDAWFDLDSKVTDKQKLIVLKMAAA